MAKAKMPSRADPSELQPRRVAWVSTQLPRKPTAAPGHAGEYDLLRLRSRPNAPCWGSPDRCRERHEQQHERRGNAVVEPTFDIERAADAYRHPRVVENWQTQGSVSRSQDRAKQAGERQPFLRLQQKGCGRAADNGKRQANGKQAGGQARVVGGPR